LIEGNPPPLAHPTGAPLIQFASTHVENPVNAKTVPTPHPRQDSFREKKKDTERKTGSGTQRVFQNARLSAKYHPRNPSHSPDPGC